MKVLVRTAGMTREEWLEWRRRGIGSSDAPAVCGLDPYRPPVAVWLEKTGEAPAREEDPEPAHWGRLLEDIVAREFAARTGYRVRRRWAILQHPDYPFMLANLDRLVAGLDLPRPVPLEIKTVGPGRAALWEGGVPDYALIQLQHQLAVTGAPCGFVAALIAGQRLVWHRVERDDALIRDLIEIEGAFWHRVETRTPPEWDGSEAAAELLRRLYPRAVEGKVVLLPPEAEELLARYDEAQRRLAEAERDVEAAKQQLQALLGDAERGIWGDRVVVWSNVSRRVLDTKALQREMPEVYERYAREQVYRRFEVR